MLKLFITSDEPITNECVEINTMSLVFAENEGEAKALARDPYAMEVKPVCGKIISLACDDDHL